MVATFSLRVTPLEYHCRCALPVSRPCLQFDQFDLNAVHFAVILLASQDGSRMRGSCCLRMSSFYRRGLIALLNRRGGHSFQKRALIGTIKGQVHGGLLKNSGFTLNLWSVLRPSAKPRTLQRRVDAREDLGFEKHVAAYGPIPGRVVSLASGSCWGRNGGVVTSSGRWCLRSRGFTLSAWSAWHTCETSLGFSASKMFTLVRIGAHGCRRGPGTCCRYGHYSRRVFLCGPRRWR